MARQDTLFEVLYQIRRVEWKRQALAGRHRDDSRLMTIGTGYAVGLVIAAGVRLLRTMDVPAASDLRSAGCGNCRGARATATRPAERSWPTAGIGRYPAHFVRSQACRLAFAVGLPTAISYATGIIAPSYIADIHHLTIGYSAVLVAVAKIIAMILGGLIFGQLIAINVDIRHLFAATALIGLAAQIVLFMPAAGVVLSTLALVLWLFAVSGLLASGMMLVPVLSPDPARRALATGLVCQVTSLLCFVSPPLYFMVTRWEILVGTAAIGLSAAYLLLPRSDLLAGGKVKNAE